jgi:hypothetical protein
LTLSTSKAEGEQGGKGAGEIFGSSFCTYLRLL